MYNRSTYKVRLRVHACAANLQCVTCNTPNQIGVGFVHRPVPCELSLLITAGLLIPQTPPPEHSVNRLATQALVLSRWNDELATQLAQKAVAESPNRTAAAAPARLLARCKGPSDVAAVINVVDVATLDATAVGIAFAKIAAARGASKELVQALLPAAERALGQMSAAHIAALVRAAAAAKVQLPAALCAAASARLTASGSAALAAAPPAELAAVAGGLPALCPAGNEATWGLVADAVIARATSGDFDPSGLAQIAEAFSRRAKVDGADSAAVFDALIAAAGADGAPGVASWPPALVATFLRSLAAYGCGLGAEDVAMLAEDLTPRLWSFSPDQLAAVLAALTAFGSAPEALLREAGKVAVLKASAGARRKMSAMPEQETVALLAALEAAEQAGWPDAGSLRAALSAKSAATAGSVAA